MANLFFDFDGVLVRSRRSDKKFLWSENIERELEVTPEIQRELFEQPRWNEIISGRLHFEERIKTTFAQHGLTLSTSEYINYWLKRDLNWHADVLELALGLKDLGHRLFIATNQDTIRASLIRSLPMIKDRFEAIFTSSDLGACKPNTDFYQSIRERHFSSKDLLVAIDDDQRNILAAREAGWSGLHFDPDFKLEHTAEFLKKTLNAI